MTKPDTILWKSIVIPGHEYCQLYSRSAHRHIKGTAVFCHERRPCRLDYKIMLDTDWRTLSSEIQGWLGERSVSIQLRADSHQHWFLNDTEQPQVFGCVDLDLNFSPSTNLIPTRRLNLTVGSQADITAAWLKFPSFTLEPLAQRYKRLEENLYRYESGGGSFVADLRVNSAGFVLEYPGIWLAEAASGGE